MSQWDNPIVVDDDDEDDWEAYYAQAGPSSRPSPSAVPSQKSENGGTGGPSVEGRETIKVALAKLDAEIKDVVAQLEPLQALHTSLKEERRTLESQLAAFKYNPSTGIPTTNGKRPTPPKSDAIDYESSSFPWSFSILATLKSTFHLSDFRLCQEGVINAAMDDRDIVCVMPTGGGKSLTYQLPAIIGARGVTVVISPLIALIWDQVRAMREYGVECVAMTGSTSTAEQNEIYRRLEVGAERGKKEIRLFYVTPEKVSKSKRLMSVLEKANSSGRLTRFVIDEAHCCSQLGHDYKKLSVLKQLFPRVPIQAVTATLSKKTLPDLLKILRLPPICDGTAASSSGTVFFTAPLYRPNLHYKVFTKPSSAQKTIEKIGEWIKANHLGKSGIIYCLSKKDTEALAEELRNWSNGLIKTGVYHAGIDEWEKEQIHIRWREGKVNVICATIAFGLGIDKGDVRYVIHHSMSKSLDGYYQETGRAGRDGQDSDCVLFYRGQDASRMQSLIYGDVDGTAKHWPLPQVPLTLVREMLRFAQDLKTCRKIAFAQYFSTSANLSANAWDHSDSLNESGDGLVEVCGRCDNCLRPATSLIDRDVTLETWRILRILEAASQEGGRVTLASLTDLVRGLGGGSFGTVTKGAGRKRPSAGKSSLDVKEVAGGKVELNKEDTEALLIYLTLGGYLEESYSANAYSINVYLQPGQKSFRLSRYSEADIQAGKPTKLAYTFLNPKAAKEKPEKAVKGKGKKENTQKKLDRVLIKGEGTSSLVTLSASPEKDEDEGSEEPPVKKKRKATTAPRNKKAKDGTTPPPKGKATKGKSKGAKNVHPIGSPASEVASRSDSLDQADSSPVHFLDDDPSDQDDEEEWDESSFANGEGSRDGIWHVL